MTVYAFFYSLIHINGMPGKNFWTGKKILVTGGAGFIGSHTVELLVERGAVVTVPVRTPAKIAFLEGVKKHIRITEADLFDSVVCTKLAERQDVVIHLAAEVGGVAYNIAHPASLFRNNLTPFLNVIEASRHADVERFLVVSSACVYPREATIPTPEKEGFRGEPERTNAGYGWAKRMQEYLGGAYAQEYGIQIAIARPFNAYGPRDDFGNVEGSHVIPGLIQRVFAGENPLKVWGTGRPTRAFVYVTDFSRGILEVAEKYAKADPVNIGVNEEISIGDLAKLIIELSGKNTRIEFDTAKPDGQPRRNCDTAKAERLLAFKAEVPLREGLRYTIDWYVANMLHKA